VAGTGPRARAALRQRAGGCCEEGRDAERSAAASRSQRRRGTTLGAGPGSVYAARCGEGGAGSEVITLDDGPTGVGHVTWNTSPCSVLTVSPGRMVAWQAAQRLSGFGRI
jgi:hypothetical protein